MHLVIVGCGKLKQNRRCEAGEMYTGQLFQAAKSWAIANGDYWLIASAKFGLLRPDQEIDPYEKELRGDVRSIRTFKFRAQAGFAGFALEHELPTLVTILAGKNYVKGLRQTAIGKIKINTPLDGMGIGQRLSFFKTHNQTKEENQCSKSPTYRQPTVSKPTTTSLFG